MSMFHGWLLKGDHPKKKRGDWITRKNQGPELEPKKARTQSNGRFHFWRLHDLNCKKIKLYTDASGHCGRQTPPSIAYMVLGNISLPFLAMGFRNCPPPAWSFCMANAQLPCFDTWLTAEMAQLCSVKLGVCPAQRAREKKYKDHRQAPEMLEAAARLQAAAAEHKGTTSGVKRDVCMSCTNSTASAQ